MRHLKTFEKIFEKEIKIEYTNNNPMWNDGWISVTINNELVEHFSVDDFLEENKFKTIDGIEISVVDDIIELMQKKYNTNNVIRNKINWR